MPPDNLPPTLSEDVIRFLQHTFDDLLPVALSLVCTQRETKRDIVLNDNNGNKAVC